jgi:hypothetical protein
MLRSSVAPESDRQAQCGADLGGVGVVAILGCPGGQTSVERGDSKLYAASLAILGRPEGRPPEPQTRTIVWPVLVLRFSVSTGTTASGWDLQDAHCPGQLRSSVAREGDRQSTMLPLPFQTSSQLRSSVALEGDRQPA